VSILVDQTRQFWLSGINAVSGAQTKQLVGWLADANYQVLTDLSSTEAMLTVQDVHAVARAYAAGAGAMASAAFESVEGASPSGVFPKTTAWLMVRAYYGAFFAAHAFLRMCGRSFSYLEPPHLAPVVQVADLYGHAPTPTMSSGSYLVTADLPIGRVHLKRVDSADGTHAGMWAAYYRLCGEMADALLASGGASVSVQRATSKLIELRTSLTNNGAYGRGTWLSYIRNRVNYQLAFGAWHPYDGRPKYYDSLFGMLDSWRRDPLDIQLTSHAGKEMNRFVATCAFVVAYCRAVVVDMANRAPTGQSFHRDHALRVLHRIGAGVAG
jgi:hypothetical protein